MTRADYRPAWARPLTEPEWLLSRDHFAGFLGLPAIGTPEYDELLTTERARQIVWDLAQNETEIGTERGPLFVSEEQVREMFFREAVKRAGRPPSAPLH